MTREELGARVRYIRECKHLTQEDVAQQSGLKRQTIINIENGKFSPRVETLEQLLTALNCEIDIKEIEL